MQKFIQTFAAKLAVSFAGFAMLSGGASATIPLAYPEKPVRIVVPLTAGSPPDIVARVVAEKLTTRWGKPVVVENRPGATGAIGMAEVARSKSDGYTIGLIFMSHTVLPSILKSMSYDTKTDLMPIGQAVWAYNVLCVPADSPYNTIEDIAAAAKRQPGKLVYGSGGNGSPSHLIAELVHQRLGLNILHVPYRGPSEALSGLLGGQSDLVFVTTAVAATQIEGKRLKAIAVTNDKRLASLPNVPTMAELGIDIELREWEGFVAPKGTPTEIVQKWNNALREILAMQDVKQKLGELGLETQASTAEELGQIIKSDLRRWPSVVQAAQIKSN